ncbi:MAG: PulJ/GspJ family protein [Acidimicrobiales bacterium]
MTELEHRDEAGFSVTEVAFAMAIMMIVLLMGLRATGSVLNVETQAVGKGQATTQVVAALNELRQEIVSANVLFDPAGDHYSNGSNYAGTNADGTAIPAGWSLRVYTQLNGTPMCVQWRVLDTGAMQTRTWSNEWQFDRIVHAWSTLASNVVNPVSSPPFSLNYSTNYGGNSSRLISVSLLTSTGTSKQAPVPLQSSIAGRDAEYYPANTGDCYPVPTP